MMDFTEVAGAVLKELVVVVVEDIILVLVDDLHGAQHVQRGLLCRDKVRRICKSSARLGQKSFE